ncbi:hypothetical protein [Adlercreutzia agrestimuris]|uniref:hypothetical protein n=1 Tax=Adlercreutzia agrestimuris TaxID=2941324 RepID=UPI00203A6949|nr:hypothetical protein [Adlercreutzia agrestimuris]
MAQFSGYGEAVTYEVGLCDAMEEWTFIVHRGEVDVETAMEDYRKVSDNEYVYTYDEQERDEFFTSFPSSDLRGQFDPVSFGYRERRFAGIYCHLKTRELVLNSLCPQALRNPSLWGSFGVISFIPS